MKRLKFDIEVVIGMFLLLVLAGSYFYHRVEGWMFIDSIYFVFMTVTTVGYGDFVPVTNMGKIFTIFFSFTGVVFAFYFIALVGKKAFTEHINRKVSQVKESVSKDVEEKVNK